MSAAAHCRNCDHALGETTPRYCPACGQSTAVHPPTVWEFVHEFVTHYVALEGKLWRTLGHLFFKPSALTVQYLAGVKTRYVAPLRLYLTASILFFLVVKFLGAGSLIRTNSPETAELRKAVKAAGAADTRDAKSLPPGIKVGVPKAPGLLVDLEDGAVLRQPAGELLRCDESVPACKKTRAYLAERYEGMSAREMGMQVRDRMLSMAPYAMFLFLPVFAAMLKLIYWRRGMYYGEHVVYALHVHAFTFLLLLGLAFIPPAVTGALVVAAAVYYWLAMQRMYGGRWWATTLRFSFISVVYPLLLCLVMLLVIGAAIFL